MSMITRLGRHPDREKYDFNEPYESRYFSGNDVVKQFVEIGKDIASVKSSIQDMKDDTDTVHTQLNYVLYLLLRKAYDDWWGNDKEAETILPIAVPILLKAGADPRLVLDWKFIIYPKGPKDQAKVDYYKEKILPSVIAFASRVGKSIALQGRLSQGSRLPKAIADKIAKMAYSSRSPRSSRRRSSRRRSRSSSRRSSRRSSSRRSSRRRSSRRRSSKRKSK